MLQVAAPFNNLILHPMENPILPPHEAGTLARSRFWFKSQFPIFHSCHQKTSTPLKIAY